MANLSAIIEITLETENAPGGALAVASWRGREAISELFEHELRVTAPRAAGLDIDDLLDEPATLVVRKGGEVVRRVHGAVREVEDDLDADGPLASFRVVLVPRVERLAISESFDVFMDLSVPAIVQAKLESAGFVIGRDFELRLVGTYASRDLVVQYKESDLAFLSRLTEHLGISCYFEHASDRDVLVFTDQNAGFSPIEGVATVPFRRRGERLDVHAFSETVRVVPRRFVERDYNYRTPHVALTASADLSVGGEATVVEYGAHFKTPEEGERIARVRAEERLAQRRVFTGKSDAGAFGAGTTFTLEGHPHGDLELLLVEVVHEADLATYGAGRDGGGPSYENRFVAIRAKVPFRPRRKTPKPRVHGVITGVVEAAQPGQYAELDEEGRYRVRFLFDLSDAPGGKASRPMRMAQPHAGSGHGMHFPLRPGVEVILTCVDGDPDRPIIAGAVPNPRSGSTVTTQNGTRNVIRTGGNNEINIDDQEGSERIKLSTPHQSTVFQLGAPNGPESGAFLGTSGAFSSLVSGASSVITGGQNIYSTLTSLKQATNVLSLAAKPPTLGVLDLVKTGASTLGELYGMASAFADTALEVTGSVLGDVAAHFQKELGELQGTLDESTEALAERTAAREAAEADVQSESGPEADALKDAVARHRAGVASWDDVVAAAKALDAKTGGSAGAAYVDAVEAEQAAQAKVDEDQAALDAKQAKSDTFDENTATVTESISGAKAVADTGVGVAGAAVGKLLSTIASKTSQAIEAVTLGAVNGVLTAVSGRLGTAAPRATVTAAASFTDKDAVNIAGSEQHAVLYGLEKAVVSGASGVTVASGTGPTIVASGTAALVHAATTAEVVGATGVKLTSTTADVDVKGQTSVAIEATTTTLDLKGNAAVSMKSTTATIELEAATVAKMLGGGASGWKLSLADQDKAFLGKGSFGLELEASKATLGGDAWSLVVDAAASGPKAPLGAASSFQLSISGGASGSVKLGDSLNKLEMSTTDVTLETATAGLSLGSDGAELTVTGNSLKVAPSGVTINGTTIKLN
jgi:type VI secretion system secreted protein VgrG